MINCDGLEYVFRFPPTVIPSEGKLVAQEYKTRGLKSDYSTRIPQVDECPRLYLFLACSHKLWHPLMSLTIQSLDMGIDWGIFELLNILSTNSTLVNVKIYSGRSFTPYSLAKGLIHVFSHNNTIRRFFLSDRLVVLESELPDLKKSILKNNTLEVITLRFGSELFKSCAAESYAFCSQINVRKRFSFYENDLDTAAFAAAKSMRFLTNKRIDVYTCSRTELAQENSLPIDIHGMQSASYDGYTYAFICKAISSTFMNTSALERLHVYNSKIPDIDDGLDRQEVLIDLISKLKNLRVLSLINCGIHDENKNSENKNTNKKTKF